MPSFLDTSRLDQLWAEAYDTTIQKKPKPMKKAVVNNVSQKSAQEVFEEEMQEESDMFFHTEKLQNTADRSHMRRMFKGNHLLSLGSYDEIMKRLDDDEKDALLLSLEFDCTTKNFLGVCDGTRAPIPSKLLSFDAKCSWCLPDDPTEQAEVDMQNSCVIFPPTGVTPVEHDDFKDCQQGLDRNVTEAYDVADIVWTKTRLKELITKLPKGKLLIVRAASDSGGSTLNTHIWLQRWILTEARRQGKSVVGWVSRCKLHQSAMVARDATECYLNLAGLNKKNWEKKTHLAVFSFTFAFPLL